MNLQGGQKFGNKLPYVFVFKLCPPKSDWLYKKWPSSKISLLKVDFAVQKAFEWTKILKIWQPELHTVLNPDLRYLYKKKPYGLIMRLIVRKVID